MIFFKKYLLPFLILLCMSCKKEYSKEKNGENSWEFKQSENEFDGPVDSAFFQSSTSVSILSIYGSTEDREGEIFIRIRTENILTGTYNGNNVEFQYTVAGKIVYKKDELSDIAIIITQMDNENVSGTFSGTVTDSLGQIKNISEGSFRCHIKRMDINAEESTLTVWTKEFCNENGSIEIIVENTSKHITGAMSVQPSCGAPESAVFSLTPGNYLLKAVCGNDTLNYNVSVEENCSFLEVELNNDYLPLGNASYWEYNNLNDVNVTQTLTADAEVDFNGNTYTRLTGTRGNFYYFRKLPHLYYQYRELSFQDFVSNPPSVELVILKDNLAKGQKWETDPLDIEISGVVQKIKLVSTIIDRDYSAVINGVQYNNLIKVNTELFFSPDNGNSYATSGSAFNTVFAKGKGIVSYNDMDIAIEWGIKNIFLSP